MTGLYLGFTADTTAEQARAIYAARYGVQPLEVLTTAGAVLAGPLAAPSATAEPATAEPEPATATAEPLGQLALFW